jgi:peptidoglycan/LPS O-acetylase OafA/YrhL
MTNKSSERVSYTSIDGVRAITHISLIMLHSAMLTTAHLPSSGIVWDVFRRNPVYTFFQAGGIQVDVSFMLSGFLLVDKLLFDEARGAEPTSVLTFIRNRALRLLGPIVVISFIGLWMGDTWDMKPPDGGIYIPPSARLAATWSFVLNYLPVGDWGSFTTSMFWSCCVDVQVQTIIHIIVCLVRKLPRSNPVTLAYRLRWTFFSLVLISIAIRGFLFEESTLNIFRLGQFSHFGLLMSDGSYQWIQQVYNHTWQTRNTAAQLAHVYMNGMYNPTHTRFGPFAVGGFLATNVFLCRRPISPVEKNTQPSSGVLSFVTLLLSKACCWFLTLASVGFLALPCFPAADEAPIEAQLFATAALRTLAASSAAFLLYRTVIPSDNSWHAPWARSLLCLPCWTHIATISYCLYLVHFRIIMELNFRYSGLIAPFDNTDGSSALESIAAHWIAYIPKLFIVSFVMSVVLATLLHQLVEKPFAVVCKRLGLTSVGTTVQKVVGDKKEH